MNTDTYKLNMCIVTSGLLVVLIFLKCIDANAMGNAYCLNTGAALVRKAVRWHATSVQDKTKELAFQHINFASAFIEAARECAPDKVLEQSSGADVHALQRSITERQHNLSKAFQKKKKVARARKSIF